MAPSLRLAALAVASLAVACSDTSTVANVPQDTSVPADTAPSDTGSPDTGAPETGAVDSGTPDTGALDATPADVVDVAMDTRTGCSVDPDCASTQDRPVCDTTTGRCVACLPTRDRCPAGRYCVASTLTCAVGCRDDDACAMTDAGVADGGLAGRCDPATHTCVACVVDEHCPLGTRCTDHACVPGCSETRGCPTGLACCTEACVDTRVSDAHCGGCGVTCALAHAATACRAGACAVASCATPWADCDGVASNGCEVDTGANTSHCGACGAACAARAHATASCASGACAYACEAGFGDCDGVTANGCETETSASTAHCGACGTACPSGVCRAGVCEAPRCDDGVRNGTETDVDCGGSGACPRCGLGLTCASGTDCASEECRAGLCVDLDASSCTGAPVLGPRAGFAVVRTHATSSLFQGVGSIVGDGAGTLYAQDPYGNGASGDRLLRIGADGAVTVVAVPAVFSTCTVEQVARGASGDLFVWNISANAILRVTPAGAVSTFSNVEGIGGGGSCSDSGIQGLLGRADGTFAATSPLRSQVIFLRADGTVARRLDGVPTAYRAVEDGTSGGLLVSSAGRIVRVAADDTRATVFDGAPLGGLHPLRRDGDGDIYFATGAMVFAVDREGRGLRVVLGCTVGSVTDLTFDRASGGAAGTSLYLSTLGRAFNTSEGDAILELRRAP